MPRCVGRGDGLAGGVGEAEVGQTHRRSDALTPENSPRFASEGTPETRLRGAPGGENTVLCMLAACGGQDPSGDVSAPTDRLPAPCWLRQQLAPERQCGGLSSPTRSSPKSETDEITLLLLLAPA